MHPRWPFPALTTEAEWEVSCLSDGTSSLLGVAVLSQQPSFTVLGPGLRCQPHAQDRARGSPCIPGERSGTPPQQDCDWDISPALECW